MADTYTSLEDPRDWRGVPIAPGSRVIYGAPMGRSIALVEGVVKDFTKSGRVNVEIVRRAYGYTYTDSKTVVHVGQDRLTVVGDLPESLMPTEAEKVAIREREVAERNRIRATHGEFVPAPVGEDVARRLAFFDCSVCSVCGRTSRVASQEECTSTGGLQ